MKRLSVVPLVFITGLFLVGQNLLGSDGDGPSDIEIQVEKPKYDGEDGGEGSSSNKGKKKELRVLTDDEALIIEEIIAWHQRLNIVQDNHLRALTIEKNWLVFSGASAAYIAAGSLFLLPIAALLQLFQLTCTGHHCEEADMSALYISPCSGASSYNMCFTKGQDLECAKLMAERYMPKADLPENEFYIYLANCSQNVHHLVGKYIPYSDAAEVYDTKCGLLVGLIPFSLPAAGFVLVIPLVLASNVIPKAYSGYRKSQKTALYKLLYDADYLKCDLEDLIEIAPEEKKQALREAKAKFDGLKEQLEPLQQQQTWWQRFKTFCGLSGTEQPNSQVEDEAL